LYNGINYDKFMALVSTIKTVVQVVRNLAESRRIYEQGLGLKCVGEVDFSVNEVREVWNIERGNFRIARFAREGEDFGCVDLVENTDADKPIRDKNRVFDFGIMTFNYRTNNIEKAVLILEKIGCQKVSEVLEYNLSKPMREVMLNTTSGERLTIIEVGGADNSLPVFNEALATVGLVVPKMSDAKAFYENSLELETAIVFQASGSPFNSLLGVKNLDKLDFATLTADGNWTGKVELLELETGETPINTNEFANLSDTGYAFVTFLAENLDLVAENCRKLKAEIIVEPKVFNRPFHEGKRVMIVRPLGGEYLEIIEN
jgi:catechol 2,3-dioxygenase-like lactoylglutathione lyase family enzyme